MKSKVTKSVARQAADAFDRVQLMERKRDEAIAKVTTERNLDIDNFVASLPDEVRESLYRLGGERAAAAMESDSE